MDKKVLKDSVEKYVKENFSEFYGIDPTLKEIKTDSRIFEKKLKIKIQPLEKKIFSFVYVKDINGFKKVLKITVDGEGKILKIVHNR